MSMDYHQCNNVYGYNFITCITCNSVLHIQYMHAVGIVKNSWSNGNNPSAYALSILNAGNIMYVLNLCKSNFSINNFIPPSQIISITLSSIFSKLYEIRKMVNNTYTNTNINNKLFADDLKKMY